jgi:hypothetical protein
VNWLFVAGNFLSPSLTKDLKTLYYDMMKADVMSRLDIETARELFIGILKKHGLLKKDDEKSSLDTHYANSLAEAIKDINHSAPLPKPLPICPPGKERNPATNRCINICKPGYSRNEKFKCVSDATRDNKTKKTNNKTKKAKNEIEN